jgi:integrase
MRVLNKRKLTPLDATRLRPKARPYMIWDTLQRGLALQVQPSGHRAYKFIYSHRGRSRWVTIGPADTISLSSARESALKLRLAVHQGHDPASTSRASPSSTGTFAVIATRYLNEHAMKRNKSWRQGDALVTRYVLPHWAERDASSISRADVRAMVAKIDKPILANQVLASTSAIFTWASKQEILTNNPCRGVERHEAVERERVLSAQEIPAFWSAFTTAGIPGLALKCLLLLGQRPGEISRLHRTHIIDNWWEMPGLPEPATGWLGTKNSESHRIWLPSPVQVIIAELNDGDSGLVFGRVWDLSAAMREICRQLGVPRATPHDLRRTFGTTVTSLGFPRSAMDRLLNHRDGGVGSIYDRYSYALEDQKIWEATAAKIIALAEGSPAPTNVVALR